MDPRANYLEIHVARKISLAYQLKACTRGISLGAESQ